MKTILCFGDSITWGYGPSTGGRYAFGERWPGVLQNTLGASVRVIEEALNGRTVATDSWVLPDRNGRAMLAPLLESHAPLDLVIITLGTNDAGPTYNRTASDIAFGCATLIWTVQKSRAGPGGGVPQVLLVAPPLLGRMSPMMALFFTGGESTNRALAAAYETVADANGAHFHNAGKTVTPSNVDGVHLDIPEQQTLGRELAKQVARILELA